MARIQIKRYNGATTQWENQFPITKAQHIVGDNGTTPIFGAGDKLNIQFLPDAVFDSLIFYGTATANVGSAPSRLIMASALIAAKNDAEAGGRNVIGYYFVVSTAGTITDVTAIQDTLDTNEYASLVFRPTDGGANSSVSTSSGALEVGDWFVIESVTGAGTSGSPWLFTVSVISNVYEVATTAAPGIVTLSSQTVYANLTGNNVITDGRLKTLIDNANFAGAGHTHTLSAITDVTATASELNVLDGITATTTELNYVDGVTSAIQTQLNGKAATSHTHTVANITDLTATATELNYVDGVTSAIQTQLNAKAPTANPTFTGTVTLPSTTSVGNVSSTELGYLDGVTSAIQTQLNAKQATITGGATTITTSNLTASRALVSDGSGKVAVSAVTSTELGYLTGVTSAIQTQFNALASRIRVFYDGTPAGMVTDDIWFDAV